MRAQWWVVQELKDQFRVGWGFENVGDRVAEFSYSIAFECPDGKVKVESQGSRLEPGKKKGGQWEGMFGYPCDKVPPTGARMKSFSLKQVRSWSKQGNAVVLSTCVIEKLDAIAAVFNKQTGKSLVVTSGIRSVAKQADLMFKDLEKGALESYGGERAVLAAEIERAYAEIPKERRREDGLNVVRKKIQAQVDAGKYVSLHLSAGSADLQTQSFSDTELAQLATIIRGQGTELNDETLSKADRKAKTAGGQGPYARAIDQHFHLNVVECSQSQN